MLTATVMVEPTLPVRFAGDWGQSVGFNDWSAIQTRPVVTALARGTRFRGPISADNRRKKTGKSDFSFVE